MIRVMAKETADQMVFEQGDVQITLKKAEIKGTAEVVGYISWPTGGRELKRNEDLAKQALSMSKTWIQE